MLAAITGPCEVCIRTLCCLYNLLYYFFQIKSKSIKKSLLQSDNLMDFNLIGITISFPLVFHLFLSLVLPTRTSMAFNYLKNFPLHKVLCSLLSDKNHIIAGIKGKLSFFIVQIPTYIELFQIILKKQTEMNSAEQGFLPLISI